MTWDGRDRRKNTDTRLYNIEFQISKLSSQIESEQENTIKLIDNMSKIINRHNEIIFGNGKPGILTDLDRLKEHRKDTEKTSYVVFATFVGLIIKTAWDFITKK